MNLEESKWGEEKMSKQQMVDEVYDRIQPSIQPHYRPTVMRNLKHCSIHTLEAILMRTR